MKVKVSTIAFSKNAKLVNELKQHFPDLRVNESGIRLKDQELYQYFNDAEGVIVGLEKVDIAFLNALPNIKVIAKYGVGLDNIDLEACKKKGVQIGWTPGVNKTSVAEMTIGFMLALFRNLYQTSNQLKFDNVWNKNGGAQLSGKTIGIIGLGYIGKTVVQLLKPFNCNILANDITDVSEFAAKNNVKLVDKATIYKESDLISIHTPLTDETNGLINTEVLSNMKDSSFIINTARGGIINEDALSQALINNKISGAALDVYTEEPPKNIRLLSLPNLICTPHIGGNAEEAVLAMGISAINHLIKYKEHK
jgi:phosphoglycerate dehydrogenase-like enzyme